MFCTGRKWCDFVAIDFHCERIEYNKTFCKSFLHKFRHFYFITILPDLAIQHKPIREPKNWIMEEEAFLVEMETLV